MSLRTPDVTAIAGSPAPRQPLRGEPAGAPVSLTGPLGAAPRSSPHTSHAPRFEAFADAARLSETIGRAHNTSHFLESCAMALDPVRTALRAWRANDAVCQAKVDTALSSFAQLWKTRARVSAGGLDEQLRFVADGRARRQFTLPGFDLERLTTGAPETLWIQPSGIHGPSLALTLTPSPLHEASIRRLDKMLGCLDLRVVTTAPSGDLVLSAPEAQWETLSTHFTLTGGGERWPAGVPTRMGLGRVPDIIDPIHWHAEDAATVTQTLQEVETFFKRMSTASRALDTALAHIVERIEQRGTAAALGPCERFSDAFRTRLAGPTTFHTVATVLPAVLGLTQARVTALLSLP